ncbi:AMP-binding protein [Mobiluncus curtisii]|nr:AMP-binding protein [Mobiluncus curtisii]MCV0021479.1 AMP-binding protein [Mobiluncus curtisii]NMW47221.1 AMP-binding protein [Mobiluncus curtisii]
MSGFCRQNRRIISAVQTPMPFSADNAAIASSSDIASFRPTYLLVVPRVLEKIYNSAQNQASRSKPKHIIFNRAVNTAIEYSRALDTVEGPSRTLRARHTVYEHLVYRKLMGLLDGRCEFVVSGGGALGERLGHFYRGVGIDVLEGYGMTESCAAVTVNTLQLHRIGTVGPPVRSARIRVTPEGEILMQGPTISPGYLKPETNDGAFDAEGWLHSGDLGQMNVGAFPQGEIIIPQSQQHPGLAVGF